MGEFGNWKLLFVPVYSTDIPLAASLPHYLHSDPSFQESVIGLHPSEDKHQSHFGLQPQFGVPMSVKIRVQLNLIVESTRFNQKIKPFDGTATPLLWLEIVSTTGYRGNPFNQTIIKSHFLSAMSRIVLSLWTVCPCIWSCSTTLHSTSCRTCSRQ